jgi:hypothetical protein
MSKPQHGGSVSDLFMVSEVTVTQDGDSIRRHAIRCRWCFAAVTGHDDREPVDMVHQAGCRVGDLIDRWRAEGNSAAVVDKYDALMTELDLADSSRPS